MVILISRLTLAGTNPSLIRRDWAREFRLQGLRERAVPYLADLRQGHRKASDIGGIQ